MGKIINLSSQSELISFLRQQTLKLYEDAITDRGTFHIALSGGRSILPFLEMFRELELQWQNIHIYQVDERIVPPDSDESNQKLIREHLCRFVYISEKNLHFVPITEEPEQSALKYERILKENLPEMFFDEVVLGLGKDCHVASLFPEGPWLERMDTMVVAVEGKGVPYQRVSLTFKALTRTKRLYLLVIGKEKLQALRLLTDSRISVRQCPGKGLLKSENCLVLVTG